MIFDWLLNTFGSPDNKIKVVYTWTGENGTQCYSPASFVHRDILSRELMNFDCVKNPALVNSVVVDKDLMRIVQVSGLYGSGSCFCTVR